MQRSGRIGLVRPHHRLVRLVLARPRLSLAVLAGIATGMGLPRSLALHAVTRALIGWNAGAVLYVILAATMMMRSSAPKMRYRARLQDEGEHAILIFACLASIASLAAIAGELSVSKDSHGWLRGAHIALAGCTVVSSWAFIQIMFALHYAHDYYAAACRGRSPGLRFPEDHEPGYGDFFYFAAIIGTSGQTADVPFISKPMRRIGSLHCILAYLFNTTVLALTINIAASLI